MAIAAAITVAAREKDMERIETMRKITIGIASLALVATLACNKNSTNSTSANSPNNSAPAVAQQTTNLSPEDLGKLGAEIKKHPKEADKLLSEKGLTEQEFVKAVRKVAESPDESKRYAAAFKKAS